MSFEIQLKFSKIFKFSKMEIKGKRCSWSEKETKELLSIIKERKILNLLDGKIKRNKKIFDQIAEEMKKKNIFKRGEQIKLKFRNIKKEYYAVKRDNGKSGAGRQTMLFFDDLDELLGERPVAAAVGVDTSTDDFIDSIIEIDPDDFVVEDEVNLSEDVQLNEEPVPKQPKKKAGKFMHGKVVCDKLLFFSINYFNFIIEMSAKKSFNQLADDLKNSQFEMLEAMKEQDEIFLSEQRRQNEDFLKKTEEIMKQDREETKNMLLEFLKKL